MRFTLLAVPAFAIAANAAAVTTTTEGPATIANTKSAISSVVTEMSKQSPKAEATSSVYVTGKAPSTVAASKTAGSSKAAPTKKASTTTKKIVTTTKKTAPTTTKAPGKASSKKPAAKSTTSAVVPVKGKKANAKRQANVNTDCSAQPQYYSYTPSANFPNSSAIITNYLGDSTFAAASKAAVTPSGYSWLWQGFYASTNADWYMSYTVHNTYNVSTCAAICDLTAGCQSFNIFYERSPALAPAAACQNPTAFTTIKCTYWNQYLETKHASNFGQWRQAFAVVVAGSNAYNKNRAA
ncbi:hypothetical protein C1H76_5257 [Elsinoe australis]|uniref:Uncharacterized protein n=1 Tax=Elsinoe australis TaxID=40998 RepID=A0A4U7AYV4_9PEZI|nr:hypothetical protein C1H76_5257 [Elsinoe australis]